MDDKVNITFNKNNARIEIGGGVDIFQYHEYINLNHLVNDMILFIKSHPLIISGHLMIVDDIVGDWEIAIKAYAENNRNLLEDLISTSRISMMDSSIT